MTCITNVILTTAIQDGAWMNSDYGSVDELNEYLCNNYQGSTLKMVHCHAGGNKGMSCDVFMAAIDYLNIEEFIEQFKQIQWDKPLAAQLLLKSEPDDIFQSYSPE
ncbi:hypothetical protein [Paraglaciecola algarum]|nr:hypothetical protein [Paraglaciecola sp. G1-23]